MFCMNKELSLIYIFFNRIISSFNHFPKKKNKYNLCKIEQNLPMSEELVTNRIVNQSITMSILFALII